ncbi:MAG: transposase [Bacillota bacterium]
MSRSKRIEYPGAVYHVTTRGDNREPIFINDYDRREYLRLLTRAKREHRIKLYGYCLMSNHTHLCLQTEDVPLSKVMHSLNHLYALYFNQRHGRVGHLFQERYFAKLCLDDKYLLTMLAYIDWNPVNGGLVSDPKDYPWSSHHEYLGQSDGIADMQFVRDMLINTQASSSDAYRSFVMGVGAEKTGVSVESWSDVAYKGHIERLCQRAAVLVRKHLDVTWEEIIGSQRGPLQAEARAVVAYLLVHRGGLTISEAAQAIAKVPSTFTKALSRPGLDERMAKEYQLLLTEFQEK